jgi:Glyoxalase/Bleomycin resistance protein/Dioxygenase superfamily
MVLPLFCCEEVASKWTSLTERWGEYLAICASDNAPVQKREEEDTGFVIHVEVLDTEQGGKEMIKDVPLTGVFVNDQEAALDFYTNTLGLEKVQDEPYGEGGARWITVSPAGLQDQDRPEEGRTRLREGPGRQIRRGANPDAWHQRRARSLRAAAYASSENLTATRGASGRSCWTRTVVQSSCSRSRANCSGFRSPWVVPPASGLPLSAPP